MNTEQIQIKISLSQQLNKLVLARANNFGVPVTQYIKYLILKEVEEYPTYQISDRTEKKATKALKEIRKLKPITDIKTYLKNL